MASALLEILLRARDDMTPAMKNAVRQVEALGNATQATNTKLAGFGSGAATGLQKIDSAGRQARIGLSAAAQAADLLGANISGVVGPAAMAADAIGDISGSISSLGLAGGILGGVVVAIGLLVSAVQAQNNAMVESVKTTDAWLVSLRSAGKASSEVAEQINRVAQAQTNLDQSNQRVFGAGSANLYIHQNAAAAYDREADALWRLTAAAGAAGEKLKELNGIAGVNVGISEEEVAATNKNAAANRYLTEMFWRLHPEAKKAGQSLAEFEAGLADTSKVTAYANAVSQAASKLRGLVQSALSPTSVDQRLKMAGDAWDEFRLRLEAVATGTDPAQYGADFVRMFNDLDMSASDAAAAFANFSLFADPKNLNSGIINWDAFAAQIKTNIQSMIGEANLMKEAFRQAVASLSPSEMRAFTNAMDLDPSAANNVDKLFEAYTSKEAGEATTTLGDMASKIQIIEGTKTTTLNFVWETAKTAIDAAHDYLEEKILQYGDVLIEITAKFNPPPPPSASGADGGGKAVGGAVFADTSYVVGEHGPEIFVPRTSGTIVPNSRVQNFGGITVSGNTFVIQNDFDMRRFAQVLNQNWGRRIAMRSAMRI